MQLVILALVCATPPSSDPWISETTVDPPAEPRRETRARRRARTRESGDELVDDRGLIIATSVSGAIWAGSTIGALVLAFEIRDALGFCTRETYLQCEDATERMKRITPPTVALVFVSGAALTGMLVPAIVLGVRRHRRSETALSSRARLTWGATGLRIRF
jgi:hypothetical protein